MSYIRKFPKDELQVIVANSNSIAEVLRTIGYRGKTGNSYTILKQVLQEYAFDISHFSRIHTCIHRTLDNIIVENSTYSNRGTLKKRLLKNGLLHNNCAICGNLPKWENKPLVLILDHINGVNNDNRIENLRLICPNCNSQTATFGGRNCNTTEKPIEPFYCTCGSVVYKKGATCRKCYLAKFGVQEEGPNFCDCGKKIKKYAKHCMTCHLLNIKKQLTCTKINGTTIQKTELSNLITQYSLESIGKEYGVTGAAIKKHCKKLEIPLGNRRTKNGTWKQMQ